MLVGAGKEARRLGGSDSVKGRDVWSMQCGVWLVAKAADFKYVVVALDCRQLER